MLFPSPSVWNGRGRPEPRTSSLHALRLQLDAAVDDATVAALIKQTNILNSKDPATWDFAVALHLLETSLTVPVHFQSTIKTKFFKRLLSFLRPDKRMFSDLDWVIPHMLHARVATQLLRVLFSFPDGREYTFLTLFVDQLINCLLLEVPKPSTPGATSSTAPSTSLSTPSVGPVNSTATSPLVIPSSSTSGPPQGTAVGSYIGSGTLLFIQP